jgi:hypothetical protein
MKMCSKMTGKIEELRRGEVVASEKLELFTYPTLDR